MIGDSADVSGARATGIPAILVRSPSRGIEPIVEDLREITRIVDGNR